MKNFTIINYGLSNLLSVKRAFSHFGANSEITGDKEKILQAEALVLPGVGAFEDGMRGLYKLDLAGPIIQKAAEGTPLLGICLGMQMMFDESDEFGLHKGLGIIAGRVEKIPSVDSNGRRQRVPNVGWGRLTADCDAKNTVLRDFPPDGEVYFVHSFEAKPSDRANMIAYTVYGGREICAVASNNAGNAVGCQFHPEKSGEAGLSIISAFIKMCK